MCVYPVLSDAHMSYSFNKSPGRAGGRLCRGGGGGGGRSLGTQDFTGEKAIVGHLRNTCSCEVPHRPQQTRHGGNGRTETAGEGA